MIRLVLISTEAVPFEWTFNQTDPKYKYCIEEDDYKLQNVFVKSRKFELEY